MCFFVAEFSEKGVSTQKKIEVNGGGEGGLLRIVKMAKCSFNTESGLEPDNVPNSKIQLQKISCLNFNVMVP